MHSNKIQYALMISICISTHVYAVDYVINTDTTGRQTLANGDTLTVNADATLDSPGGFTNAHYLDATIVANESGATGSITNHGSIVADDLFAITTDGTNEFSITNHGTLSARDFAVLSYNNDNFTLTNHQQIQTIAGPTISDINTTNSIINNHGTIVPDFENHTGLNTAIELNNSKRFTLNNTGTMMGNHLIVWALDSDGIINNHGTISSKSTNNANASIRIGTESAFTINNHGIIEIDSGGVGFKNNAAISLWSNNIVNNYDTIRHTGSDGAIYVDRDNNTINNYGTLSSATGDISVIFNQNSSNNTLRLLNGSNLQGAIEFEANSIGNVLEVGLGPGIAYSYPIITRDGAQWSLIDLDGKITYQSDTEATGIATTDINSVDEVHAHNTQALSQSLRRYYAQAHNRNQAFYQSLVHADTDSSKHHPQQMWSDLYLSHSKHDGNNNSSAYEHKITGISLIQPGGDNKADLIANLQRSKLEIDDANQEIKSQTLGLGLQHPALFSLGDQDISARVMLIHGDHDSTQNIGGVGIHESDYNSQGIALALGAGVKSTQQNTNSSTYLEAEILHERVDGHKATSTFYWDDRKLTQLSLSAQNLWQYDTGNQDYYLSAGLTLRKLISGEAADYQANGNPGTYVDESTDDVSLNLGAGIEHRIDDNSKMRANVDLSQSNEDVLAKTLSLEFDWQF